MTKNAPEDELVTENIKPLTRYGKPIYKTNPSIVGNFPIRIKPMQPQKGVDAYVVSSGTGEVLAQGSFSFIEEIAVDEAQFVKIYLEGIRKHTQLSKSGALLFEFVYREMSGMKGKDKDTVALNFLLAQRWKPDLSKRTYERGINELLEKEFLFRSLVADVYFINIRFMYNGNRINKIKSYYLSNFSDNPPELLETLNDK